jgi:hemerythrin-like domain-containing protein
MMGTTYQKSGGHMVSIEMLRKQHTDLIEQVDTIRILIKKDEIVCNATMFYELLSKLSTDLGLHLLIEDDLLYPALMKYSKETISDIAKRFVIELGGIKEAFKKYNAKWDSHETTSECWEELISETEAIAAILKKRIDTENNKLFPCIEKLRSGNPWFGYNNQTEKAGSMIDTALPF